MTIIRNTLVEILENQAFDRLEPFKHTSVWKGFSHDEKTLLARLLVMEGAHQLAQGNQQVLENFNIANQISSNATEILYQQGMILSSYRENIRCLTLACQAFKGILQQDPAFFKAWISLAHVLMDIGLFEGEATYLIEAHQHFDKTFALLSYADETFRREEFFWKWGVCLASLGKVCGEPLDFYQSIEKFRQAQDCGCQEAHFFIDFGKSLVELGSLLERPEYFAEAILLFNQAILKEPQVFDGWFHQACCMQRLIEFKIDETLLEQANESFIKAAEINPQESELWLKWGQLDTAFGKLKRDEQKLEASLLKFAKAYQLEPGHPQILKSWAESELFLGVHVERLDLIQSAKLKILNSLEIEPQDPHSWYLYGSCLSEIGHYFSDENSFHQAIEKFQYGLSLTRQNPLLWYGMALAHFALGELTEQQALFEKTVRYCARVIEYGGEGSPQFWNDWGVALLKLGEMTQQVNYVEMAIEKFERALNKMPSRNVNEEDIDLEWVYNYGCAFDLLGDLKDEPHYFDKAVQILTQILQIDPNYHVARYNLALGLSHLGEAMYDVEPYHKAMEHFQFLVDLDPEDEMLHLDFGMSLTNLGLLVHDMHHPARSQTLYHQAENHFMQAVALGNAQAYYQLAGLYSITEHFDQAMHFIERAQFCGILPGIEDLLHDEWLERLRHTSSFRQFINDLSSQQSMDDK